MVKSTDDFLINRLPDEQSAWPIVRWPIVRWANVLEANVDVSVSAHSLTHWARA